MSSDKRKSWIAAAGGVVGVGALAYYMYRRTSVDARRASLKAQQSHSQSQSQSQSHSQSQSRRPQIAVSDAVRIISDLYNIKASKENITELPSYDDKNFLIRAVDGKQYVLKIYNITVPGQSLEVLAMQDRALAFLRERKFAYVPAVIETKDGQTTVPHHLNGVAVAVRVLQYLDGTPARELKSHSLSLLQSIGETIGELDKLLQDFSDPSARRPDMEWSMANAITTITKYLPDVKGHLPSPPRPAAAPDARPPTVTEKQEAVRLFMEYYTSEIKAKYDVVERISAIHSDINDTNILANAAGNRVLGILDFGDLHLSKTVTNLANATAYFMLGKDDPLPTSVHIIKGYLSKLKLTPQELELVFPLACMRICVSVCCSAHNYSQEPSNDYLLTTSKPGWTFLSILLDRYKTPQDAHIQWIQILRTMDVLPSSPYPSPYSPSPSPGPSSSPQVTPTPTPTPTPAPISVLAPAPTPTPTPTPASAPPVLAPTSLAIPAPVSPSPIVPVVATSPIGPISPSLAALVPAPTPTPAAATAPEAGKKAEGAKAEEEDDEEDDEEEDEEGDEEEAQEVVNF